MGYTESIRKIVVNGVLLRFYYGKWAEEVKEDSLYAIPGTNLYVGENNELGDLMRAAKLEGEYDYSKPQDWFDAYVKEHGEAPVGVWYYPPRPDPDALFGRFVSREELLERVGEYINQYELA